MKKVALFLILMLFWIVLLFPKNVVWGEFVRYMQRQNISITTGSTKDLKYKFIVKNVHISYGGLDALNIKEISLKPWLLYNKIHLKELKFSKKIPMFNDVSIQDATALYSIISPASIKISGVSSYGKFRAKIELFKRKIVVLVKTKSFKNSVLKQYFKKTKEGMSYEYKY